MNNILDKIVKFLENLLNKLKGNKSPAPTIPNKEIEPEDSLPKPPPPIEHKIPIDPTKDPTESNLSSQVETFLWKPQSDTDPKVSVITVSADELRSDELFVEIYDKSNTLIPGLIPGRNKWSSGRGNQLPGYVYGRINYKMGLTDKQFSKYAPIKVRFYIEQGNIKTYIKIMGKDSMSVKDPTKRLDLK